MKKCKIAIILATEPYFGGGHQYAMLVAECLAQNAGLTYELIAICYNRFWRRWCRKHQVRCMDRVIPSLKQREKIVNYKFPYLCQIYNTYMTPMGKLLRKEGIDILFSTQQFFFIPNYSAKIIVPVHDLMHRYETRFPEVMRAYSDREIDMKSYMRYACVILTDSKLGKSQLLESYRAKRKKVPHIISLPFVAPEYIYNANEEYIDVPDRYIFYPAQFWNHKNHINLVKAIRTLRDRIEDIHLILVGSEKNCCKKIKKYIINNGLENNVTILGYVSNGNIAYLYKHAVGMVMPSYFGPTNIPPLEAMLLGCPVAVSDKYAMPEQVGNAGLLFNPDSPEEIASCIEKLWMDENLRERLKKLGYKRVKQWNKEKFNKRLLKVVKEVEQVKI